MRAGRDPCITAATCEQTSDRSLLEAWKQIALGLCPAIWRQALIEEVRIFRVQTPIIVVPTAEARQAVGVHLWAASQAAFREIAMAAKGLEIAHLQFAFRGLTLAVCSRVRRSGVVEIEMGLGDPRLPASCFTAKQLRDAESAARARSLVARGTPRLGLR